MTCHENRLGHLLEELQDMKFSPLLKISRGNIVIKKRWKISFNITLGRDSTRVPAKG